MPPLAGVCVKKAIETASSTRPVRSSGGMADDFGVECSAHCREREVLSKQRGPTALDGHDVAKRRDSLFAPR